MTDRRDEVPTLIRHDLARVAREALGEARTRLARSSRFSPFAIVLNGARESRSVRSLAGEKAVGTWPVDLTADIAVAGVRATRGHGTTYLVVHSEHRDGGPAMMSVVDYRRSGWLTKVVTLGEPHETLTERSIWLGTNV